MPASSDRRFKNWLNRLVVLVAMGAGGSTAIAQTSGEPVTIGVNGP